MFNTSNQIPCICTIVQFAKKYIVCWLRFGKIIYLKVISSTYYRWNFVNCIYYFAPFLPKLGNFLASIWLTDCAISRCSWSYFFLFRWWQIAHCSWFLAFCIVACAGAFLLRSRTVASILWHLMFASFRLKRPRALSRRRSFARRTSLPRENRGYCAWLLRSLRWIIPFSFMINASSKLLSPALPKKNNKGLILWRKATVSKCFRRQKTKKMYHFASIFPLVLLLTKENIAIRWHFRNDNIARKAIGHITAAE